MPGLPNLLVGLMTMALMLQATDSFRADPPKDCHSCAEWNSPREPFRVFGNSYYVGVAGLAALLVTSIRGTCCSMAGCRSRLS
jgi:metallo-beta-lactamase class B